MPEHSVSRQFEKDALVNVIKSRHLSLDSNNSQSEHGGFTAKTGPGNQLKLVPVIQFHSRLPGVEMLGNEKFQKQEQATHLSMKDLLSPIVFAVNELYVVPGLTNWSSFKAPWYFVP